MRKTIKQTFIILGALAVVGWWSGPARAAEYGGIGGRPTQADPGVPNSDSWFIYALPAGQMKEDAVEVQNNGATAQDLVVYAADSTSSSDGGFALKQEAEKMSGVGSWIRFYPTDPPKPSVVGDDGIIGLCNLDPVKPSTAKKPKLTADQAKALADWCAGQTTVEANVESLSKVIVPFVVTIPADADVGEHSGGIAIQKKAVERQEQSGSAVILTTRVGVRIYETVPGDIIRHLRLTKFLVQPNARLPEMTVVLGVQNDGNVSVDMTSVLTVSGTLWHGRNQTIKRTSQALRGEELVINTAWPRPAIGRYRFQATVTYNDGKNSQTLSTPAVVIWIVPWLEVGIAFGVIALALAGWLWYRRRQRRRYSGQGWQSYTVKKGDDLVRLAESRQVEWRTVAKVNKLAAPYRLEAGTTVLLPPAAKNGKVVPAAKSEAGLTAAPPAPKAKRAAKKKA